MPRRLSSSRRSLSMFLLLFWLFWLMAILNQHPLHFQCTWTAGLVFFPFFLSRLPSPSLFVLLLVQGLQLPAFFSCSCSRLPSRPLPGLSPPVPRPVEPSTCSGPPPRAPIPSPPAASSFSSASYVPGRHHSTISSGGLGGRVSKLSLKFPPSPPAWNGKCDKWNRTRLNFVWKFQTYDVQIGS